MEFALVVPILLVLVMGIAEFGRACFIQTTLSARPARVPERWRSPIRMGSRPLNSSRQAALGWHLALAHSVECRAPTMGPPTPSHGHHHLPHVPHHRMFGAPNTLTGKGVMRCNG